MKRRQLLFVSPRFLFPADEGGKIRTGGILRAMKGGAFKIVLASPAPANAADYRSDIAAICDRFVSWPEPRRSWLRRGLGLLGSLPMSAATDRSAHGQAVVATELSAKPDVIVVDFPHAAVLAPGRQPCPSVMFTHNVETEIFERHAAVARAFAKPLWRREAAKMQSFEHETLRNFDTVVAVSERDKKALVQRFDLPNVAVIDTGVDLEFYGYHPPAGPTDTVVFAGAMDSHSNIEGIKFLMDEVWPVIVASRPQAQMLVAGRNPPPTLVANAARKGLRWTFTGFVDDIRPQVLAGDVSVIPLRVGSGTRLKAVEAMALGRPVVSTSIGIEGIAVEPNVHFLMADSAADFAAAILRLLEQVELRKRIAGAARALLEERFSAQRIGKQFETICLGTAAATAA